MVVAPMGRILTAFIVAPLIVPVIFFLDAIALRHVLPRDAILTIIGLPYAYAAEIVFGLPTAWMFRHYRITSLTAFALAGGLIGFAVGVLMAHPNLLSTETPFYACILAGVLASIIFRRILFSK
jgi:hypothetical protein